MAIRIGRIAGIPIALDYSWFIIFFLVAWTVGFNLMPQTYPGLSDFDYLFIGVLSSFLLFGSVLIHELAHSIVAKRSGLQIRQITLFLFGGVSEMEEEPRNPTLELKMSAAGPLTSLGLALISGLLWLSSRSLGASALVQAPLEYTALVNGIVAAFNLIPAFPMDGGRVFRSLLWRREGDLLRSTRTASNVGRLFAYILIFGGILLVFAVDFVTGFWLILIGWFISSGAQTAMGQTIIQEDLRGLRASDIMTRKIDSVSPDLTLEELSQEFLRLKHNGFPVLAGEELRGCVTMGDLRKVRKDSWATTRVGDVMVPRERLVTIKEDEVATRTTALMGGNRIGRLFVLNAQGKLTGIITRSDILKTVQLREGVSGAGGGRQAFESGISFTVERGMNFVLEQPVEAGLDWTAEFAADGIQLVNTRVTQNPQGQETKQFTFQAINSGKYLIRVIEGPSGPVEKGTKRARRPVRTVRYDIAVA